MVLTESYIRAIMSCMRKDLVRYQRTNLNKQQDLKGLSNKDIKRAIAFTKIYFFVMALVAFMVPILLITSYWHRPLLFDLFGVIIGGLICFIAMLIPWGLAIWALMMMTIWGGKIINDVTKTIFNHRQQRVYNIY